MELTKNVADYVAQTSLEALPAEVVARAKRVTLDSMGVIAAATAYAPGKLITQYVANQGGRPAATVLGTDIVTAPQLAALANGTMAADMELDEIHLESAMHPSSVMVPALLAVAEDRDVSGSEWITSLVTAYDIGCRMVNAMRADVLYARGFHPTALGGIIGATAGAARLLRLSSEAVIGAFGLAACQTAGLLTWETEQEHYTKSFQSGAPARSAVTAVELAELGYWGARGTFDGRFNVFEAFAGHRDFEGMSKGLGQKFEIMGCAFKVHSSCRITHGPIDILLDLARQEEFTRDDVASVDVLLPRSKAHIVDNNELTTHNVQFILAAALSDGAITRTQTSAERRAAPDLQAFASRVSVLPDDELEKLVPLHRPARLIVRLHDGREFDVRNDDPKGDPTRPFSDQEIEEKFLRSVDGIIPDSSAREAIGIAERLEQLPSIRELVSLFRV